MQSFSAQRITSDNPCLKRAAKAALFIILISLYSELIIIKTLFTGCAAALVTPFKNGSVDYDSLGRLIDMRIMGGSSAVVVCGTTGEGSTLAPKENESIVRFTAERVAGRIPVIAGTGSNDTYKALMLSKNAEEAGADALLLVTPYYNKTSQNGLIKHYKYIADWVNIPLIVYNVPSRTGMTIAPETCLELSRHPNIIGIKEADTNFDSITRAMALCGDNFDFYGGNDTLAVPFMSIGGKGLISVAANIAPDVMSHMCALCLDGSFAEAAKLNLAYNKLMNSMFSDVNPIPVKTALGMMGLCDDELRAPLCAMNDNARDMLRLTLAEYGLL